MKTNQNISLLQKVQDKGGNLTTVRMPLYVVNQRVAYEGGRNE